jgi:large subunit ribosomal protein L6
MSKLAKKGIAIPDGVEVKLEGQTVAVKGPKGELAVVLHPQVEVSITDKEIKVAASKEQNRRQKSVSGTFWSILRNAVQGVTQGFEKKLEIIGVGYKAQVNGEKLVLNLGYSHPVELEIPKGLEVKVEKNVVSITGFDKQVVGQFAAQVRSQRKPEPYKGKGIKYSDEVVRRKAGKVVKAVGAG